MPQQLENEPKLEPKVTVEEVNRVLEVGKILFSVLTEDEIKELERIFAEADGGLVMLPFLDVLSKTE